MIKKTNQFLLKTACSFLLLSAAKSVSAQDNSPYSRYGLGDAVPTTNIINRSMGGISAGFSDPLSVNYNNPASYSGFKTFLEERSKKAMYGRVVLDVGVNISNRTLRSPNNPERFTSSNAGFSYLQLGIPLRKNWGMSFGLRPLTRVGYKIASTGPLVDARTGATIDSAYKEFSGDGGSFLPSIGTGFAIKNFSIGVNAGYLFGKKDLSTRLAPLNDSFSYHPYNYSTRTSFGGLFFEAGAQYKININKQTYLRLGVAGNWKQNLSASQDVIHETFLRDGTTGDTRLDSVSERKGVSGEIIYPGSYTAGFVIENQKEKGNGWMLGADLMQSKWSQYRFYGQQDAVQDNWQLRVGGHFRPEPARNYFSNVTYRAGFFYGNDHIKVNNELPVLGFTLGMGLPISYNNRLAIGQYTILNVGLEFSQRGNNANLLKENMFRLTFGLNFSDLWFNKRKYD